MPAPEGGRRRASGAGRAEAAQGWHTEGAGVGVDQTREFAGPIWVLSGEHWRGPAGVGGPPGDCCPHLGSGEREWGGGGRERGNGGTGEKSKVGVSRTPWPGITKSAGFWLV